ncbi:MAG: multidrug effflux MFS transporter [Qingshengfaniella sp.]
MSSAPSVRFLDRSTPPHIFTLVILAGLQAGVMNIFLPSMPNMAIYFETNYRLVQLSVSLYLAASALLQMLIGSLSDRYGRRPIILGALGLFMLATLGAVLAPTIEIFLAFRMAQAVIAAGMVLSRAIVRDMFPPEQSASMLGYVTMGMALIPMVSPLLGGALEQLFGWKANFIFMLIAGGIVMVLVWYDLGETAANLGQKASKKTGGLPELLRSPRFWGYASALMFSSGTFFAYLGGAPFVGTVVFGLSPAKLGLYFGAPALGYALGNFLSGRLSVRMGLNAMCLAGTIVTTGGLALSLLVFYLGFADLNVFFGFMCVVGFGNGMVMPNATAGMLSVRPHLAGTASGLGGAMMIGGGAALAALAGGLLAPETGAYPLLWVMFVSSLLSIGAIQIVRWRARQLRGR